MRKKASSSSYNSQRAICAPIDSEESSFKVGVKEHEGILS